MQLYFDFSSLERCMFQLGPPFKKRDQFSSRRLMGKPASVSMCTCLCLVCEPLFQKSNNAPASLFWHTKQSVIPVLIRAKYFYLWCHKIWYAYSIQSFKFLPIVWQTEERKTQTFRILIGRNRNFIVFHSKEERKITTGKCAQNHEPVDLVKEIFPELCIGVGFSHAFSDKYWMNEINLCVVFSFTFRENWTATIANRNNWINNYQLFIIKWKIDKITSLFCSSYVILWDVYDVQQVFLMLQCMNQIHVWNFFSVSCSFCRTTGF